MTYLERFADEILAERLRSAGAVLVEGAKGCGKTETSSRICASVAHCDADERIRILMDIDPKAVLAGAVPRLIDEWQEYPTLWNFVRREIDTRRKKGQFVLTGSAVPDEQANRHSGVGRFSVMRMRPMSLFEKGWSSGEVSLGQLIDGAEISSHEVPFSLKDSAEKMCLGGWPGLIGENAATGLRFMIDYMTLLAETDISRVSNKQRDPVKVARLLRSLARNISTEVSIATLAHDIGGDGTPTDRGTVAEYLDALTRLMALDDLPAWSVHPRSAATLRKAPKRHFADPSMAIGALQLGVDKIVEDLNYFGLLFESMAVRDLRIYAEVSGAQLFHYRDSQGMEVDAIVERPDGTWAAFEIKTGLGAADAAANNLLAFASKIDIQKTHPPATLCVITGNGFAHVRKDGVRVVPLATLTA